MIVSEEGPTPDWLRRSPTLAEAYGLASEAHRGQPGKDGRSPYIHHPLAVAERLAREGHDEATLAAAILHDVVERSGLGLGEVVARFGAEVGELVSALTDDRSISDYEARKREHRERVARAGPGAAAIYAADKIVNVRELRRTFRSEGRAALDRLKAPVDVRVRLWREDAAILGRLGGASALAAELRGELDALEAELARARRSAHVA